MNPSVDIINIASAMIILIKALQDNIIGGVLLILVIRAITERRGKPLQRDL
jgi:hypothetical protein